MRNTALKCIAFSLCKINVPIYLQKGYMDKKIQQVIKRGIAAGRLPAGREPFG